MSEQQRNAIAAAVIILVFGVGFYFMPAIMQALGSVSVCVAFAFAALFVLAFFGIFWIRSRKDEDR